MSEKVIEYGSKSSYLLKRRKSATKIGANRREVLDAVIDNIEANPLHRFSSSPDLKLGKDDDTTASSTATSYSSLPGIKEDMETCSKQNARWGSRSNSMNSVKLVDRGHLLIKADRASSRLLGQQELWSRPSFGDDIPRYIHNLNTIRFLFVSATCLLS